MVQSHRVIWITGLSGSGKTTLAKRVVSGLKRMGHPVVYLDGDDLREVLIPPRYSDGAMGRDSRLELARQYAALCGLLAEQGVTVVIATISMFREVHSWNRANLPNYLEIFLRVPLQVLRNRDPKGIYEAFAQGELSSVAGLDLKVDEPLDPDLVIDNYGDTSIEEAASLILKLLGSAASGNSTARDPR